MALEAFLAGSMALSGVLLKAIINLDSATDSPVMAMVMTPTD